MSSLITKNFRTILAKQVYNLLDVTSNYYLPAERKSYVYAMVGKQLPWNSGTEIAPTPLQTDFQLNNYFKTGIVAKQITPDNASLIVPRINWQANTIYNEILLKKKETIDKMNKIELQKETIKEIQNKHIKIIKA